MQRNLSATWIGLVAVLGMAALASGDVITNETIESYSVAPDGSHPPLTHGKMLPKDPEDPEVLDS